MSAAPPAVAICIVTHDDATDLPRCLESIANTHHRPLEVVIVDCASTDDSVDVARRSTAVSERAGIPSVVRPLDENRGFAGGMNAAFAATDAPFLLTLNADASPDPDYVSRLLARLSEDDRAAAVTGRLVRPGDGTPRLDACGMRLTRSWRHFDRGSGKVDHGQYRRPERVFGATGAATLWRRRALDDVAFAEHLHPDTGGEHPSIFDPDFHSFREDAELCFRLQARGWAVLYEPTARAEHRRTNLPSRRRSMPAFVNRHSLKNRYLLRLYHQTGRNALLTLAPTLLRDLGALAWVATVERSSWSAYTWLWRRRSLLRARRAWLAARRTHRIDRWFRYDAEPV